MCGDFTCRVSDCEELVGEVSHTTECVADLAKTISDCISNGFIITSFTTFTIIFPYLSIIIPFQGLLFIYPSNLFPLFVVNVP